MALDSFGFGTEEEIQFTDPWGDNIPVPFKNGEPIRGSEAAKYNPDPEMGGFKDILYKGHTGQKIRTSDYSQEDIQKAMQYYTMASKEVKDPQSLTEIADMMEQLGGQG